MIHRLALVAIAGVAAIWPVQLAVAEHDHHDRHDRHHHDDDHGGGFGIHLDSDGGVGLHFGHGDHHDFDRHDDYGHHHHHHSGWHDTHWHDSAWDFVLPHYDSHYHGTYYLQGDEHYYVPQTFVTRTRSYVAAEAVPLAFGGYSHVDDLAGRLEREANQLCLDLHYNYRHNPDFAATYREAYQILTTARYIHDREHQGERDEVARRLDEVDRVFHHVQEDVTGWSRRQKRQIGQGGVQAKLQMVEATLHHLLHDVGVEGSHGAPDLPPPTATEVAPPPPAN
jgi:hypothetical protein